MKLKKKTRKQLRRLARAAGALGTAFATEALVAMTASFTASREVRTEIAARARTRRAPPDGAIDREHERAPLPRTADEH